MHHPFNFLAFLDASSLPSRWLSLHIGLLCRPATENPPDLLDQFAPYSIPGLPPFYPSSPTAYPGTIMRFPLRTPEQAARSDLRPRLSYTPDMVLALFHLFIEERERPILFLHHVQRIELMTWDEHAGSPTLLYTLAVDGTDLPHRAVWNSWLRVNLLVLAKAI